VYAEGKKGRKISTEESRLQFCFAPWRSADPLDLHTAFNDWIRFDFFFSKMALTTILSISLREQWKFLAN
jgi:hypothetical protein